VALWISGFVAYLKTRIDRFPTHVAINGEAPGVFLLTYFENISLFCLEIAHRLSSKSQQSRILEETSFK
jgi:hypothetical protein